MTQLSLGLVDKEFGAALALEAKMIWASQAEGWVVALRRGDRFTADDLIDRCGTPVEVAVNANNAVGALFLTLHHRKLIHSVGRVASRRRSNHGRFITMWERL